MKDVSKVKPLSVKINIEKLMSEPYKSSFEKLLQIPSVSGPTSFKIKRIADKTKKELEFYAEARLEKLKAFANKDADNNPIIVKNEKTGVESYELTKEALEKFTKVNSELLAEEVELTPIKYETLGSSHSLVVADIMQLDFIIE